MLVIAAFSGALGFSLGLRLGMFSLIMSTVAVATGALAFRFALGDYTLLSCLVAAGVSAVAFQLAALACMSIRHGVGESPAQAAPGLVTGSKGSAPGRRSRPAH